MEEFFGVLRQAAGERDRFQALSTFRLGVRERARELQRLAAGLGFFGEELGTRAALLERFCDYFRVSSPVTLRNQAG